MEQQIVKLDENKLKSIVNESLKKILDESYAEDGNYSHFAVNKTTNKIVNGWDYNGYDQEDLKLYKNDYFTVDLKDYGLDPKQYTILTLRGCKQKGIDPYDDNNWANE